MIGERLSEIRKDHKHTQADLASLLNVTVSAIRSWEQGKSSPPHEMLVSICRLYGVSSDYLLGLSNTDPAYTNRIRQSKFSKEDLENIKDFENYLLWKKRHH